MLTIGKQGLAGSGGQIFKNRHFIFVLPLLGDCKTRVQPSVLS